MKLFRLALCLSVGVSSAAWADIKAVSVVGEAAVVEGDPSQTEANARRDARRKAVEQGAGILVTSNSLVRNYELLSDEIATTSKGILTDEQWGPLVDGATKSTKRITLAARVSPEAIEGAICSVVKQNHDPKVSLVFVEKMGDDAKWSTERGIVESMFASAFKDSCFTLMEAGVKVTEVSANGDLNQETIDAIVKNSNAQYVVLGSARIMLRDKSGLVADSKMNSYSVSANLKLVNTSTNEIEAVAAKSVSVQSVSPEMALKISNNNTNTIVATVMDEIVKKVAQRWTSDLVNAGRVQVIVQQVPNMAAAKAFKELMARVAVGSRVDLRDVKGGLATFDVDVPGGAEALSALVEGRQAGKLTVEVVEMSRGKMVVRLK